ncbi:MAG: TonB-dependent receptor [Acidobacteriota bacterium]
MRPSNIFSPTIAAVFSALVFAACLPAQSVAPLKLPAATAIPDDPDAEAILFDTPPAIETASLYAQSLKEAPASVTVITDKQIRRQGFRTLAQALNSVRGFYFTSDGYLQHAGVRGFGLPGDLNTRILVMVNGHNMTDNVYGAMYLFGQDFGIDMDLVQRIEIVRGPSSALYGSNGIFATINIFTRAPADSAPLTLSTSFGSFGEKKSRATASLYLGRGANLLVSLSGFHSTGRDIAVGPFGSFAGGDTNRIGAEQGYHSFAQLTYRNWNFMANFSDRRILAPGGLYKTDFGDPGTQVRNAHNFVEAAWNREVGKASSVRVRFSYDQLRYFGRYDYADGNGGVSDGRDNAQGDWVGSQVHFRTPVSRFGTLTLGAQFSADIRNRQRTYYFTAPETPVRDTSARNAAYGLFAQQEWNVSTKLTVYAGLRFDDTKQQTSFLSPRLAVVYKASPRTSYKLMYGRAFRNPSTYEKFWEPNPQLAAERMNTYEFSAEHSVAKHLELVATVYHYRLDGLIEGVAVGESILQYRNVSKSRSTGAEIELQGQLAEWLHLSAAFSAQRSRYSNPSRLLPNSPTQLVNLSAAVPLLRKRLDLSAAARYLNSRQTAYGGSLTGVTLMDLTVSTQRLSRNYNLQFGVRNLTGAIYGDPVSQEHSLEVMPQAGRSFFIKLTSQRGD